MSTPVAVLVPRARTAPAEPSPWLWSPELIAAVCNAPVDAVRETWPLVYRELAKAGAVSPANCAAALATIAIETASSFQPVMEAYYVFGGTPFNYDHAAVDEYLRTHKPSSTYYPDYGRGFIQLTHRSNYLKCGNHLGIDLLGDRDRALRPDTAAQIFAWYWTVERPMLPIRADEHDWSEVRRLVQGGSSGLPRLMGICAALLRVVA